MELVGVRRVGSTLGGEMVSVLLPVFNSPTEMLDQAVASVLAQTYAQFELLILDDGSESNETGRYLESIVSQDSRIVVSRGKHCGLAASLNRGITLARGEWIARQDDDDWSEPSRFARQIAFLEANPEACLVGTAAALHSESGRLLWTARMPRRPKSARTSSPFFHGSVMFRRDAAIKTGGYCEALETRQDREFFERLLQFGPAANLPDALYHYRYRGQSLTAGKRPLLVRADHHMLAGDFATALTAYRVALRYEAANWRAWAKLARYPAFRWLPPVRPLLFGSWRFSR